MFYNDYIAIGVQDNGDQFIGVFRGNIDDITAYVKHNHPAYDHKINPVSPIDIPEGYAIRRKTLLIQQAQLKAQLTQVENELKARTN